MTDRTTQLYADYLQTVGVAARTPEFVAYLATRVPARYAQSPLQYLADMPLDKFAELFGEWVQAPEG